ncbi:uncharacterized protein B0I36DRAFT_36636 [Microdochium trichocladiopsis]|uniref:C2H2-type domain-containing protein n=1 Tax=Microdochium trichocladiopsis TaxID=1682393 RepID=A0A9P8XTS6_9PEZI|nr:uncharacterized protein B0I36DRAFT_36636 [Microdochium trichocladiopsis]KAH7018200.1 hypothetical protein B0I36DRAFT_36636 [Microdochium trichocladiopsis]
MDGPDTYGEIPAGDQSNHSEELDEAMGQTRRTPLRFEEEPMPSLERWPPNAQGRFECWFKDCGRNYPGRSHLAKHLRKHFRPVICPVCPRPMRSPGGELAADELAVDQLWRCAEQRDMERHVLAHHTQWAVNHGFVQELIRCPTCNEEFTREDNLRRHERRAHGG